MEIGSALEIYLVKTFSEKEQTLSHIAEKYRFNMIKIFFGEIWFQNSNLFVLLWYLA